MNNLQHYELVERLVWGLNVKGKYVLSPPPETYPKIIMKSKNWIILLISILLYLWIFVYSSYHFT